MAFKLLRLQNWHENFLTTTLGIWLAQGAFPLDMKLSILSAPTGATDVALPLPLSLPSPGSKTFPTMQKIVERLPAKSMKKLLKVWLLRQLHDSLFHSQLAGLNKPCAFFEDDRHKPWVVESELKGLQRLEVSGNSSVAKRMLKLTASGCRVCSPQNVNCWGQEGRGMTRRNVWGPRLSHSKSPSTSQFFQKQSTLNWSPLSLSKFAWSGHQQRISEEPFLPFFRGREEPQEWWKGDTWSTWS